MASASAWPAIPNYDAAKPTAAYQGFAADAFSKERAARWADPAGGYIHAMHVSRWGGYHYRITGKNPDGTVAYEGGWQNNRQMGMHKDFRMVENIFEELDAPGEWFHNAKTNTLYFMPEPGTDLATAVVEVVRLRHLVEFQGSSKSPVRFITLKGFIFRHAARTFMETKEPLLRSDWTIYRGGAVLLNGTEDVSILDSEFDQVGGNAIFVNNYNRRALIKGCHIHDAGASGVCFVGDPAAVRDPLFEYGKSQDLDENRPHARTEDRQLSRRLGGGGLPHPRHRPRRTPAGGRADFHGLGNRRAGHLDLRLRAGGHQHRRRLLGRTPDRALRCFRHRAGDPRSRVVQLLGPRPLLGQQPPGRFRARGEEGSRVCRYLDAMKPTVIRDSRWRCDHGWDIDLDDGSSTTRSTTTSCSGAD